MIAYAQGNHEFRLVAAIHQQTLAAIMTVEGRGITTPKDLAGKVIADQPSSVVKMLWPTYARLANVDPNSVRWQGAQASDLPILLGARRADAVGQFVVGVPTIEAATKGKAVVLPYSSYLRDLFGIALATRADLVTDKPDLVKRFRAALLKGLDYSLTHPEEAAAALKAAQPAVVEGPATAELRLMGPYVRAGTTEIGVIEPSRVARAIAIMAGSGAIPLGSIEPDDIVAFDLAPGAAAK
jgi:NitT/TauT family transport system substrate-binding protein